MAKDLTWKQRLVLEFIKEHIMLHGFAPTASEVAEHFHTNIYAAQKHIDRLYVKGYVRKFPRAPRGLVVLKDD